MNEKGKGSLETELGRNPFGHQEASWTALGSGLVILTYDHPVSIFQN